MDHSKEASRQSRCLYAVDGDGAGVVIGVDAGVALAVAVGVASGVELGVALAVAVGVTPGVDDGVGVTDAVGVGDGVFGRQLAGPFVTGLGETHSSVALSQHSAGSPAHRLSPLPQLFGSQYGTPFLAFGVSLAAQHIDCPLNVPRFGKFAGQASSVAQIGTSIHLVTPRIVLQLSITLHCIGLLQQFESFPAHSSSLVTSQ